MGFAVQVITPPTVEPVGLAELQKWLRIDPGEDDDTLRSLEVAARRLIERTYDCALVTQTLQLTIDRFPIPSSPYLWQQYSWGYWWQRIPMMNLTSSWWPERAAIFVPRPPLQSINSIQYVAQDGTTQTVDPGVYTVDNRRMPGRIVPGYSKFWPFTLPSVNSVTVNYQAGYGAPVEGQIPSVIPETIRQAIKVMVHDWYEDRRQPGVLSPGANNLLMAEWDGEYY
jgi:uncharacterized phiE125 gp8 family phage protein